MEGRGGRGRGRGLGGNPCRRGSFRGPKPPTHTTLSSSAPTKTRREEAIQHSYRKMVRKEASRGIAIESQPKNTQTKMLPQIKSPDNTSKLSHDRRTQPTTPMRDTWKKPAYQDRNKGNKQPWKSDSPNFDRARGSMKRMLPKRNNATEAKSNESDEGQADDEATPDKANKKRKLSQFQRAKRDMDMKKQEVRRRAFERKKIEEERAVAQEVRKQKRIDRNKLLNQRKTKGCHLKGQIQMILDKLQSQSSKN